VQAVFITRAVLSITCCLFITSVQSWLRAYCLYYVMLYLLRACSLYLMHTVFITCVQSSWHVRSLHYMCAVFITCMQSSLHVCSLQFPWLLGKILWRQIGNPSTDLYEQQWLWWRNRHQRHFQCTLEASIFIASILVLKAESFRTIKHFVLLTGNCTIQDWWQRNLTILEDENKQQYALLKYLQYNKHYIIYLLFTYFLTYLPT